MKKITLFFFLFSLLFGLFYTFMFIPKSRLINATVNSAEYPKYIERTFKHNGDFLIFMGLGDPEENKYVHVRALDDDSMERIIRLPNGWVSSCSDTITEKDQSKILVSRICNEPNGTKMANVTIKYKKGKKYVTTRSTTPEGEKFLREDIFINNYDGTATCKSVIRKL